MFLYFICSSGREIRNGSAELSAISAILGYLPSLDEYRKKMEFIDTMSENLYRYLNFDQMADYQAVSKKIDQLMGT